MISVRNLILDKTKAKGGSSMLSKIKYKFINLI